MSPGIVGAKSHPAIARAYHRRVRKPPVISPAEADLAHAAAQRVVEVHRRLVSYLKTGLTLAQIDAEVAKILESLDCRSCFLHYKIPGKPPFTGHACLSVNQCVVHGTPASYAAPIKEGDLLKIDIGVVYRGWIGDAGWTYAIKNYPSNDAKKLMRVGREALRRGIEKLRPENTYMAWARTVHTVVEVENQLHLVKGLGGHGIGKYKGDRPADRGLHLPPFVANMPPSYSGEWPEGTSRCEPGTLIAVEPMLAIGTGETREDAKYKWPVYSADNSLTAHYEHDVLITPTGPRVLSEGMDDLPDIVG